MHVREEDVCSVHWSCWSPPGVPSARYGSPSRATSVGESVVRGRLPGSSEFGSPSSSQNICARVPRQKPSVGDHRRAPEPAAARRRRDHVPAAVDDVEVHGVAPRVGSPTPGATGAPLDRRRRAAARGRRASPAEARRRLVADQRSPLVRVRRARAASSIGTSTNSGSPYHASRSANASFAHSVTCARTRRSPGPARRGRSPRAGAAAAGRRAPGSTGRP